jgi:hypothetical protein
MMGTQAFGSCFEKVGTHSASARCFPSLLTENILFWIYTDMNPVFSTSIILYHAHLFQIIPTLTPVGLYIRTLFPIQNVVKQDYSITTVLQNTLLDYSKTGGIETWWDKSAFCLRWCVNLLAENINTTKINIDALSDSDYGNVVRK